jgi:hypothetical protein
MKNQGETREKNQGENQKVYKAIKIGLFSIFLIYILIIGTLIPEG